MRSEWNLASGVWFFFFFLFLLLLQVVPAEAAAAAVVVSSSMARKSEQPFRFKNPARVKWVCVYGLGRIALRLAYRI